jgi:hypothetical protein
VFGREIRIKYLVQDGLLNSDATVPHFKTQGTLLSKLSVLAGDDLDGTALTGEIYGIGKKIQKHLFHLFRVHPDRPQGVIKFSHNLDFLAFALRRNQKNHFVDHLMNLAPQLREE